MKIGILTFVNAVNFGAVLQAYGTQSYLKANHIDSELINYTPCSINGKAENTGNIKNILKKLSLLKHPFKFLNAKITKKNISNFKNSYLKISPYQYIGEIFELKEDYDIIIAGSDQIWNTGLTFCSKSFFLNFNTSAKKTGYAVSVGKKDFSDAERRMIHEYAHNFDMLSVREKNLKEYLKEVENIDCNLVCDPVFLPDKNTWDNLAVTPSQKNYILVYTMEYNDQLKNIINKLKKTTKKKVYCINGGGDKAKHRLSATFINHTSPQEFIGWIKNADIVLTNSFHGTAFRLIFGGKLLVLEHSSRNERLSQILNLCKHSHNLIKLNDNFDDIEKHIIDANQAYNHLNDFIQDSRKYMMSIYQE